jgi:transcriptional regulator with XRE-family HTH domain
MNRSLYGERDYAFGQRILTLRTQLGLTQAGLAERLHVSRRAVTEWEIGSSYPKAKHLQQLIALGVRASARATAGVGEALAVPTFYDREQELATLARWVVEEGCRLEGVLGMGGMGKSALVVRAMLPHATPCSMTA